MTYSHSKLLKKIEEVEKVIQKSKIKNKNKKNQAYTNKISSKKPNKKYKKLTLDENNQIMVIITDLLNKLKWNIKIKY